MKIQFTEDFATKKKGEVWDDCDDVLASYLINQDKVAIQVEEGGEEPKPKAKTAKARTESESK